MVSRLAAQSEGDDDDDYYCYNYNNKDDDYDDDNDGAAVCNDNVDYKHPLWLLRYKAATDGWSGDSWMTQCENQGPSITLVR